MENDDAHKIRPKVSIDSENIFYVESIMEHILREFCERPQGYDETVRAYGVILVTMLARSYLDTVKHPQPDFFENNKQYVLHCIEYIKNSFSDNLSLEEISKRSTMSKGSFCALFKKLTGRSFNSFLNLCRIQKATEYISEGYKLTAISSLCGYNDFSTFYRNFKKIMGVPPNEYKKDNEK
jgi:YesN/AraC family two-component response regulator